eukprot:TRINITY_DN612_c0_g1_i2.p1 TRINITY_DN612_c0_g1~~TRINITY_DN612_c0_g1_i2.p1  ORF type:complete len:143 (+),score=1.26 TRINITY_DN612_c0_g1_i2:201-629(+)
MDRAVPHGQDGPSWTGRTRRRSTRSAAPTCRAGGRKDRAALGGHAAFPMSATNMLADTWTPDKDRPPVRKFLADHFLDKRNRHLVFTTHHPITALLNESLSQRDAVTVDLPQVFNVKELKTLDNSRSSDVSKCYAAFIPLVI